MIPHLQSPLSAGDHRLLRLACRIAPVADREDFARLWHAELWHKRARDRRPRHSPVSSGLTLGILRDALWLRGESCRRSLEGTALLCLASFSLACVPPALLASSLCNGPRLLSLRIAHQLECFLVAAAIVAFVTFAISPRRTAEGGSPGRLAHRLTRCIFLSAKSVLLLVLVYLLSLDLMQPLHAVFPITADLFQILCFVFSALVALRWAFHDQERRCKHCLRTLAPPTRIGRPSRNLLEWNGTRLTCRHGHGLLSVPELETSWYPTSQWTTQPVHLDPLHV